MRGSKIGTLRWRDFVLRYDHIISLIPALDNARLGRKRLPIRVNLGPAYSFPYQTPRTPWMGDGHNGGGKKETTGLFHRWLHSSDALGRVAYAGVTYSMLSAEKVRGNYGWTIVKPSISSKGSKSRSLCKSAWPFTRQKVAIKQSTVLRTVRPFPLRYR